MRPLAAQPGDAVAAIDTPALVVDLDALERNVERMASFVRERGLRLRPHAKTHKCAAIARLQLSAGAVGVCVQKLSEAEALADAGIDDIYVSNQIVDARKLERVAQLARRVRLALAVDHALGIERLADAVQRAGSRLAVYVEIDVGQGRCGALPRDAAALAARVLARGLSFAGLQAYHGGAQHVRAPAERKAAIDIALARVHEALAGLHAARVECPLVSGAGTGSFVFEAASRAWGELQAGSYVFMDRDYADNDAAPGAPAFEHALFVKSQVVSRSASHAVIDAGHKSHAIDSGSPGVHGRDLGYANGGDEHGILRGAPLPALGETVWLVPGHCDPTVNLHDHYVCLRGGLEHGTVEAIWPVDARGCVG